jgi:hypothetical protein
MKLNIEVKIMQSDGFVDKKMMPRAVLTEAQRSIIESRSVAIDAGELELLIAKADAMGVKYDLNLVANDKPTALSLFSAVCGEGIHECSLFRISEQWERLQHWLKVIGIIIVITILLTIIGDIIIASSINHILTTKI